MVYKVATAALIIGIAAAICTFISGILVVVSDGIDLYTDYLLYSLETFALCVCVLKIATSQMKG